MGFVAILLAWDVGLSAARADDCLPQPNSRAPEGNHWYYHMDRATQRKCWYLRALDQPAQHPAAQTTSEAAPTNPIPLGEPATASGGASTSAAPGANTPPMPHIKMLTVVSSGATDKLVQQRATQRNTTSITAAPAPEESAFQTDQTGDQANEPARAAAVVWPDPPTPAMATAQDPIATPIAAPTEAAPTGSVQTTLNARASADDAQDTAQAGVSTNSASRAKASVVSDPVEMFLVAALGLVVAGFLFRIAMTARRRRIFIVRPDSHWLDYRNEHELRDEQQHAGPVHQREELIDDYIDRPEPRCMDDRNEHKLRDRHQPSGSVWHGPRRPFRNDYKSQEDPQRRDRDSDVVNEISEPEDMLEQLRRDLDRLLRSPKVA